VRQPGWQQQKPDRQELQQQLQPQLWFGIFNSSQM